MLDQQASFSDMSARDKATSARDRSPILVTGAPRSGSTWLGNVLSLAPNVGFVHEPFNQDCSQGLCRADFPHSFVHVTEANEALYLEPLRDTLAWRFSPRAELRAIPTRSEPRPPRALARLLRDYAYFEQMRRTGARMIIKDPIALFSADWIARRFGAKVVVLIRHPAAFVASMRAAGFVMHFEAFRRQPSLMEGRLAPFADEIRTAAPHPSSSIEANTLLWRILHHHIDLLRTEHPDWISCATRILARSHGPVPAALRGTRAAVHRRGRGRARAVHQRPAGARALLDLRHEAAHHALERGLDPRLPQPPLPGRDRHHPPPRRAALGTLLRRERLVAFRARNAPPPHRPSPGPGGARLREGDEGRVRAPEPRPAGGVPEPEPLRLEEIGVEPRRHRAHPLVDVGAEARPLAGREAAGPHPHDVARARSSKRVVGQPVLPAMSRIILRNTRRGLVEPDFFSSVSSPTFHSACRPQCLRAIS